MTQAKGDKRVNLHLLPNVHARLKAWCRRNGLNLQDGLATMVDLCARETNGLRIPQLHEPAPHTLARPIKQVAAAPVAAAPPQPAPPPEPEYEDVDAIFERERSEVDPDALFASALARGESREEARKQVKAFMSAYDLPEDEWEPLDATVCNEIVSANGSNAVRYADDTEEEAREPDADARDARPH